LDTSRFSQRSVGARNHSQDPSFTSTDQKATRASKASLKIFSHQSKSNLSGLTAHLIESHPALSWPSRNTVNPNPLFVRANHHCPTVSCIHFHNLRNKTSRNKKENSTGESRLPTARLELATSRLKVWRADQLRHAGRPLKMSLCAASCGFDVGQCDSSIGWGPGPRRCNATVCRKHQGQATTGLLGHFIGLLATSKDFLHRAAEELVHLISFCMQKNGLRPINSWNDPRS
jgi:hypothetical protein